jgi:hypothetical protein
MTIHQTLASLAVAAALLSLALPSARADECQSMEKAVQGLINRHDPTSAKGNAACSGYGYGLGLLKARRIVADECMDEGQDRTDTLAKLDRSIRTIQSELDKNCQ